MRVCNTCGVEKPLTDYKRVGPNKAHMHNCLTCYTENRRYNRQNGLSKMDTDLRRRYGITEKDYYDMLEAQGGKCKTCGSTDPIGYRGSDKFCVDHDHKTGRVRGLLCNHCNRSLGLLKEDVATLRNMIKYIES